MASATNIANNRSVIETDHTKSAIRSNVILIDRILIIVVIELTVPKLDESPGKWRLKIARSTEAVPWTIPGDCGGYTVHPVPALPSTIFLNISFIFLYYVNLH